jgi:large subunit ribosomal protein L16
MVRIRKSSHRPPIPHFVRASGSVWEYISSDKFLPYNFYNFQKIAKYTRRIPTFLARKQIFFQKNTLCHVSLVAASRTYISDKSIETLRRFLRRMLGKHAVLRPLIYPKFPRTQKPVGVRMGKGKGKKIIHNIATLSKGQTIFDIMDVSFPVLQKTVRKLAYKLHFSIKIIRLA